MSRRETGVDAADALAAAIVNGAGRVAGRYEITIVALVAEDGAATYSYEWTWRDMHTGTITREEP